MINNMIKNCVGTTYIPPSIPLFLSSRKAHKKDIRVEPSCLWIQSFWIAWKIRAGNLSWLLYHEWQSLVNIRIGNIHINIPSKCLHLWFPQILICFCPENLQSFVTQPSSNQVQLRILGLNCFHLLADCILIFTGIYLMWREVPEKQDKCAVMQVIQSFASWLTSGGISSWR